MDFLKNNIERILLLIVALALIAFSARIMFNVAQFDETFQSMRGQVTGSTEIDTVDTTPLEQALARAENPTTWERRSPLFTSRPYIERDGQLINPEDEGYDLHPPVPNRWLLDNNLDLLDPTVLSNDPDNDGFTNLEEWKAGTDPQDAASHPPHHTKLRLAEFISIPFRLLFAAYSGDSFQINTIDVNLPTQFLRVGDDIRGTPFQIDKFEQKTRPNPRTGAMDDISELTIAHKETGEEIVLVLRVTVDSPDSFAKFRYLLDSSEIQVKKEQPFPLPPSDTEYKLIDITPDKAVIENVQTGEKVTIPKLEGPQ